MPVPPHHLTVVPGNPSILAHPHIHDVSTPTPYNEMAGNNPNGVRLHPNGKRHVAIRDVKTVYANIPQIPMRVWRSILRNPKRTSNVTPEQVQAARLAVQAALEEEEAWSVLHDIDTQWGMCPQGVRLTKGKWVSHRERYEVIRNRRTWNPPLHHDGDRFEAIENGPVKKGVDQLHVYVVETLEALSGFGP
ncbi:hypothetical protein C8Q80DRAFT_1123247 [Daedaleopsis nitida]|nr:hypothetical protein C8Q80DRAFT_1123247 [Daedaleopsis nitida]